MTDLEPDAADLLLEQVARLKHDLGKYVAWTSANLPDEAWEAPLAVELMQALRSDLLETRKPREGDAESAWALWARESAQLAEPWPPELERVGEAVARLAEAGPSLAAKDIEALARHSEAIRAAQSEIRSELRALQRRLLRDMND